MSAPSSVVEYELATLESIYTSYVQSLKVDPATADLSTPWTYAIVNGSDRKLPVSHFLSTSISNSGKDGDDDIAVVKEKGIWLHKYRFNKRGRLVVKTNPHAAAAASVAGDMKAGMCRELLIVWKTPLTTLPPIIDGDISKLVGAVDLNCYHIGYPLDLGDIEDVAVCPAIAGSGVGDGDVTASTTNIHTINCPLHNRIFDLDTGDMVRMEFTKGMPEALRTPLTATSQVVACGKRKDGVIVRDACRQRVHPVRLSEAGRVVVTDSLYTSDSYQSDKYNTTGKTAHD